MEYKNWLKNFLKGMGSVMEIFPSPPKNPFDNISDHERLASDWKQVGNDLRWAIGNTPNEHRKP